MLFHTGNLVAVCSAWMNDSPSDLLKHSQVQVNNVVTNSRPSSNTTQVYLERIDYVPQAKKRRSLGKYHKRVF